MTHVDLARYWRALNRLREETVRDGQGPITMSARKTGALAVVVGGVGAALIVPFAVLVRSLADIGEYAGPAALAALGLGLAGFAARIARGPVRAGARRRAHRARRPSRDAELRAMAEMAERNGSRGGAVLDLARDFLVSHWPDSAPAVLLQSPTAEATDNPIEERLTWVGEIEGCPFLVALFDYASLNAHDVELPVIVVLVAAPLAPPIDPAVGKAGPFRASARPRSLEDTDAHRDLTEEGFAVHWTHAGIAAVRHGATHAPLDRPGLERVVASARELCRDCPAADDAPSAPGPAPELDESSCRLVLESFLGALASGDAMAAIERAHPRLFVGWPTEPSVDALNEAVDAAKARPRAWANDVYVHASSGGSRTLETLASVDETKVDCINLALSITRENGETSANVCMLRLDGRSFRVSGYSVGSKLVAGVLHPPPGD